METVRPERRYPLWLAAMLPALLFVIFATVTTLRVSKKIAPDVPGDPARVACVETYGITLNQSEYYVREFAPAFEAKRPDNSPELSTVLRGMVRNGCGHDLKNVRLHLVVHDDAGRTGEAFHMIQEIADGEVKSFERAWMGRVVTYEVAADR